MLGPYPPFFVTLSVMVGIDVWGRMGIAEATPVVLSWWLVQDQMMTVYVVQLVGCMVLDAIHLRLTR